MEVDFINKVRSGLLHWYDQSARSLPWRDKPTPYRVWVSEIMLQQTRVEAVKPYFERFMDTAPTVQALAQLPYEQLMKLWEGLGYYSRARNLKKAAGVIVETMGGLVPGDVQQLQSLPGIGPYTSGAIASIAYGVRVPAVDGNVMRVISRLLASYEDIAEPSVKKRIEEKVFELLPLDRVGAFNQALMELGATICVPNGAPKCSECPVQDVCEAHLQRVEELLPVKAAKKQRKIEKRTVLVLCCGDLLAVRKREEKGLLAGLWELPNVEGWLSSEQADALLASWGMKALTLEPGKNAKHIFTHREWHMISYQAKLQELGDKSAFQFFTIEELEADYSIPTAFKLFLK